MPVAELIALQMLLSNLDELPYCTGTVPLDATSNRLFYQSRDGSRAEVLDFTKVTDQELDALCRACEPATFGHAQKDVLDESYRKAGKMDAHRFATNFSPTGQGILEVIGDQLLRGRVTEDAVSVELYKLNVYGPGGFFKAHVDTPRCDTMFGSLVVILPTVHEGGSLVIRNDGKQWTFDSAKAVSAVEEPPHAAFIAFFSDVEHEVTPVLSGFRVTLTYNLYLRKKNQRGTMTEADANDAVTLVAGFEETDDKILKALEALLKNTSFLSSGGFLGFGLKHKYPFNQVSTHLSDIKNRLKGPDAVLKRVCDSLSLHASVKALYRDNEYSALVDHFADFSTLECESDDVVEHLRMYDNGLVVDPHVSGDPNEYAREQPLVWGRPLAKTNPFNSAYIHYGNERTLAFTYGEICLVATVPPARARV